LAGCEFIRGKLRIAGHNGDETRTGLSVIVVRQPNGMVVLMGRIKW